MALPSLAVWGDGGGGEPSVPKKERQKNLVKCAGKRGGFPDIIFFLLLDPADFRQFFFASFSATRSKLRINLVILSFHDPFSLPIGPDLYLYSGTGNKGYLILTKGLIKNKTGQNILNPIRREA
jgi:hypothetical protein